MVTCACLFSELDTMSQACINPWWHQGNLCSYLGLTLAKRCRKFPLLFLAQLQRQYKSIIFLLGCSNSHQLMIFSIIICEFCSPAKCILCYLSTLCKSIICMITALKSSQSQPLLQGLLFTGFYFAFIGSRKIRR